MTPIVLYRNCQEFHYGDVSIEENSIKKFFPLVNYRSQIPDNSLVIGRYSVLPFYKELEDELALKNSKLVNSYSQHNYIADICNWYEDIKEFTPVTFTTWGHINEGKWVVKGKTSSRKHNWNTHMFADGREQLLNVVKNLLDDPLISKDGLVVREYIPLKRIDTGINGLPITKEWRTFFYKDSFLAGSYYWSNFSDEFKKDNPEEIPADVVDFATKVAKIVSEHTNFFVLDIAEKESGGYVCIEINDGQMSGLSDVKPDFLYGKLKKAMERV